MPPTSDQPSPPASTILPQGRFRRSWLLLKQSLNVLKLDKELALFPVYSAITTFVLLVIISIVLFAIFGSSDSNASIPMPAEAVILFVVYFVSYSVTIFFNSALVAAAIERFRGGDPTLGSGLAAARKRLPAILMYAAIAATVGLILRLIIERSDLLGRIVTSIIGFAWSLAVTFIAPVLVMTELGPVEAIKESANTFRKVWGEDVIGGLSISLALFPLILLSFVPFIAGILLAQVSSVYIAIGFALTILALIAISIIVSTCQSIFNAALYLYATTGQAPTAFDPALVQVAYKQKHKQ